VTSAPTGGNAVHPFKQVVAQTCRRYGEIMAAYVFGSVISRPNKKPNDLDVALLIAHDRQLLFPIFEFMQAVEKQIGLPVDVIILK